MLTYFDQPFNGMFLLNLPMQEIPKIVYQKSADKIKHVYSMLLFNSILYSIPFYNLDLMIIL